MPCMRCKMNTSEEVVEAMVKEEGVEGWEAAVKEAVAVTVAAVLEVSDWVALVEVVKVVVVVGLVVVEWGEAEAADLVAAETAVADWAVVETGWVEADLAPQCCTQKHRRMCRYHSTLGG